MRRGLSMNAREAARYQPGETVTELAFTSASVGRAAFGGNHRFVIQSRHGKRVEEWSAYRNEREVLFAAGTRFRVLRVEKAGSVTEVWLEEVD